MKSYTDINQSKKLAEILPLESADVIWNLTNPDLPNIRAIPYEYSDYNNKYLNIMPAWSLAALFDVLPKFIGDYGKCLYYDVSGYYCGYMIDGDFMITIEETKADNPVDACVEMIIKLHEQKLF